MRQAITSSELHNKNNVLENVLSCKELHKLHNPQKAGKAIVKACAETKAAYIPVHLDFILNLEPKELYFMTLLITNTGGPVYLESVKSRYIRNQKKIGASGSQSGCDRIIRSLKRKGYLRTFVRSVAGVKSYYVWYAKTPDEKPPTKIRGWKIATGVQKQRPVESNITVSRTPKMVTGHRTPKQGQNPHTKYGEHLKEVPNLKEKENRGVQKEAVKADSSLLGISGGKAFIKQVQVARGASARWNLRSKFMETLKSESQSIKESIERECMDLIYAVNRTDSVSRIGGGPLCKQACPSASQTAPTSQKPASYLTGSNLLNTKSTKGNLLCV